ncbi:MAG: A/G-specific adenine glycosylase [Candidatus Acidiferrales bacterium]
MNRRLTPRQLPKFQRSLLAWYRRHKRNLPWRASRDSYRIWVAEIMLQQTRIAAVLPYYERFLEKFPNVGSLARAPQPDVLRLWSGLGYYSRARNLHAAARAIVAQHGGEFPRTLEATLALPGIGRYTAAAVLSIAYDVPLAVLDGNVARILARLNAIRGDLRAPRRWRQLGRAADQLLAHSAPGDWNQALMELGETICTPQNPRCTACPVAKHCLARARNLTSAIPTPRRKPKAVQVRIAAAILSDPRGRTLLVRDPGAHDDVLFSRMWQFPAIEVSRHPRAELERHLRATLALNGTPLALQALPAARHGVTFRNVTLLPFLVHLARLPKPAGSHVLPLSQLHTVPISSATRKVAEAAGSRPLPADLTKTTQERPGSRTQSRKPRVPNGAQPEAL